MGQFQDSVVIVTGGGMGIGERFCRGFAKEGARVAVADIAEEAAKKVAQDLGGVAVRVDVSDEASTRAMA